MVRYKQNFKKVVWGWFEVEAENIEEAQEKLESGLCDEFDNKSEYEFEDIEEVE